MANKIVLKKSSVAAKVPLATDLDVGEIAVNLVDKKLYSKDAGGTVILVGTGSAATVAGSNTQIQYNNSGAFGASAGLTFDGTNFATTGTATAKSFIPTSATIPAIGMYKYDSTTLGLSAGYSTPLTKMNNVGLSVGLYSTTPTAKIHINSNYDYGSSYTATTTNGIGLYNEGGTITIDGINSYASTINWFNVNSLRATNLSFNYVDWSFTTVTNAATLYIEGVPAGSTNGANTTGITNPYALYVASGKSYFGGSITSIGTSIFSGNNKFGSTATPTVPVDVAGAVLASGNITGGYNNPANGTTAMAFGSYNVVKVTPNASATYTTTIPAAGTRLTLIVLTSGTSSYTITFGTGFKTTGTLVTGTTSARYFNISFVSDGSNVIETGRTVAIA
jgi:hypothetical protein